MRSKRQRTSLKKHPRNTGPLPLACPPNRIAAIAVRKRVKGVKERFHPVRAAVELLPWLAADCCWSYNTIRMYDL